MIIGHSYRSQPVQRRTRLAAFAQERSGCTVAAAPAAGHVISRALWKAGNRFPLAHVSHRDRGGPRSSKWVEGWNVDGDGMGGTSEYARQFELKKQLELK